MSYEHILSPLTLRNVTLKNRVVRTAHGTSLGMGEPAGLGPNLINYHVARAKGGVGLTILEIASVHSPSCHTNLAMYNQGLGESYHKLMEAVAPYDMAVMQQLWHSGNHAATLDGSPCWAPSDVPSPFHGLVPTPMTSMMIDEITEAYIKGARLAKDSGLAGVEVHSGHSYLPQQFMSPAWNRREDEYGGSLENRMRFIMDILTGIRSEVGDDFIISVRLSDDELEESLGIEENQQIIRILESSGAIDLLNCSRGSYCRGEYTVGAMNFPTGYQLEKSAPILEVATVPRLVAGRFRTLEEADQGIRLGQADLVSMVRATIADPNVVTKTMDGRPEDVRPCIACNHCVTNEMFHVPMTCAINATTGSESIMQDDVIESSETARRVVVIGGGPAGMESARILALAGHKVALVEAGKDLGGQINLAKQAPFRLTIADITHWQEQQLYKLGVDIRLNTYFTAEDVMNEDADGVVVATGSLPRMDGITVDDPSIATEGVENSCVLSSHDFIGSSRSEINGKVIVADDVGHYEGIAVAEYALSLGAEEVIFVTRHTTVGPQMEPYLTAVTARRRLYATGRFRQLTEAKIRRIAADGTVDIVTWSGTQSEQVEAEAVVLVSANACNREIYDDLSGRVDCLGLVGDANSPRFLHTAIREGNHVAREMAAKLSVME